MFFSEHSVELADKIWCTGCKDITSPWEASAF